LHDQHQVGHAQLSLDTLKTVWQKNKEVTHTHHKALFFLNNSRRLLHFLPYLCTFLLIPKRPKSRALGIIIDAPNLPIPPASTALLHIHYL
jgi:hypothetical protein